MIIINIKLIFLSYERYFNDNGEYTTGRIGITYSWKDITRHNYAGTCLQHVEFTH